MVKKWNIQQLIQYPSCMVGMVFSYQQTHALKYSCRDTQIVITNHISKMLIDVENYKAIVFFLPKVHKTIKVCEDASYIVLFQNPFN